ncbi:hypothetical protein SDC9_152420 [bioreactor metagenome]|uniref:Uncharacterized protein n=1 Tax=bioreactor metagenome TaxID=1076179 RepID=A0A645EUN9_9ZZZZ
MALARLTRVLTKNRGEDIVEVFGVVALVLSLLELTVELRVIAVLPELIVLRASLLIAQHFPGFSDLFKAGFSIGFFTDIGMIFASQSAVSGLDSLEIVRRFHAHDGVIIL